jgi:P-type Cu+ transporter
MKKSIDIEGMHCAGCTNAVQKAIEKIDGVKSASVQLTTEQALVEWEGSGEEFPLEEVSKAVEDAGYSVRPEQNDGELILEIGGMHCSGCSNAVEKAIGRVEGVKSVNVNLTAEKAFIEFDASITGENDITEAVREAGYEVTGQKKKGLTA